MNTQDTKKTLSLSESDLAKLGGGALAYIREIKGKDAIMDSIKEFLGKGR